jgi:ribose transport system ATP-binding protein
VSLLTLRGIEKRFGATVALDGVDLEVAAGEVHALIGENGAGKSTLLNILSGWSRADRGEMQFDGGPYAPQHPSDARRRGIAHIHQELALCPHLPVAENILMAEEPATRGWLRRGEMFDRAAALLAEFGRGEIDPHTRTGDLSLAARQIVEICRALAWGPRLILMDEPTSSLQRGDVERLFRLIRQLADRDIAMIYISHFLEEVREIADRYTVLRDGKSVGTGALTDATDEHLIALMVGRNAPHPPFGHLLPAPRGEGSTGEVLLRLRGVELRRGEILGIAGLIGSGRTELVRSLFALHPDAGYLSEDRKGEGLALPMSIADNVTISRFSSCSHWGWIDRSAQERQTEAVMQRLRIKAAGPRTPVVRLSGGNQQKVALGRLLHQDADILLLDEPARGIDIGSKSDIYREIAALAAAGKAILVVSSYLPELFAICDRIAVMTRGHLSEARPTSEWTPESIMQAAVGAA